MSNIWKEMKQDEILQTNGVNYEGFPNYQRDIKEQVISVLTTGSTANLFYVNAKDNIKNMLELFVQCEDTEFLAKATLYAREEGFIRTLPIASLVEISKRDKNIFKKLANQICKNPHDWQQFIDISRSGLIRNGLGRALKQEIQKAISAMSTYHAIKYPQAMKDMINISRPREGINSIVINYIKKNECGENIQLSRLEFLKESEEESAIICAIDEGKLPYEVVTGASKLMTTNIRKALLYQAPYFNLIRNLNNFGRNGVFDDEKALSYACAKIISPENIKHSKLLPFRYWSAWKNLDTFKGSKELKEALQFALRNSVENIPILKGKVAIASDVSGSMHSNITSDKSEIKCSDIVGVFSACMMDRCEDVPIILPFNRSVVADKVLELQIKRDLFERASVFDASGGTSLSAPVEWLMDRNERVDKFIGFTDNEEWIGSRFIDAFLKYRETVAPKCKAYLVTLLPYRHSPVPSGIIDVHLIYGWSEQILKYISSDVTAQIAEVENIEI